jgi:pimeloyl-ACP methyl ester carboxylesterase
LEEHGLETLSDRSEEMRRAIREHRSAQSLAHAARGMLAQSDSRVIDHLPNIDVPTLIIVGDRDEPFLAPSRYMASKIPGARLEVIEGAGHHPEIEQSERFVERVVAFLEE